VARHLTLRREIKKQCAEVGNTSLVVSFAVNIYKTRILHSRYKTNGLDYVLRLFMATFSFTQACTVGSSVFENGPSGGKRYNCLLFECNTVQTLGKDGKERRWHRQDARNYVIKQKIINFFRKETCIITHCNRRT
jgi:hypothetical protein